MPSFTTTTIRPSAKISDAGFTGSKLSDGTTPTVLSAINDNSDNTYARKPASSTGYAAVYSLADPSPTRPSSSEFVWYIRQNVRLQQGTNGYLWVGGENASGQAHLSQLLIGAHGLAKTVSTYSRTAGSATVTVTTTTTHGLTSGDAITIEGMTAGAGLNGAFSVLSTGLTTTQFQYTSTATTAQSGSAGTVVKPVTVSQEFYYNPLNASGFYVWDSSTINVLRCSFSDSGTSAGRARIYDVSYDIVTTPLPTVSITDIDGDSSSPYSVTTTTRPVLNFTYAQADGVGQNGAQVRVFTSTKTDPTNDTALVWDSGVLGNVGSVTIGSPTTTYPSGVDLSNGTTYYVYVRVGTSPSGIAYNRVWSAWGSGTASSTITFSVSLTAPTAPTLTSSWNTANATTTLTISGSSFATGSQTFSIERSNDGGTTWYPVRGGTNMTSVIATAADPATPLWVAGANTSVSNDTSTYRTSSPSLKLTPAAIGRVWANSTGATTVPVQAGYAYNATGYFKTTSGTRNARLRFDWYNATGFISATDGEDVTANSTGWTQATLTANAPTTATYLVVVATVDATTSTTDYQYLDDVIVSAIIYDYEAERGTTIAGKTVKYRARANGVLTSGGATVSSAWQTVNLATTNSGTWILRSFQDAATTTPLYDLVGARVLADVAIAREENVGVFRPLGRSYAVVIHGDLQGKDGEWTVMANATEWTTLEGILNGQKIVLVTDPFGIHRYVRITARSYTIRGGAASPWYEVNASYVEVGSDLAAGA